MVSCAVLLPHAMYSSNTVLPHLVYGNITPSVHSVSKVPVGQFG